MVVSAAPKPTALHAVEYFEHRDTRLHSWAAQVDSIFFGYFKGQSRLHIRAGKDIHAYDPFGNRVL